MEYTQNYNLKKPEGNEYVDNDQLNDNFDTIDDELKKANTEIGKKVNAVEGKGFSTNDYTTPEKNKLAGIAPNANNYVHPLAHSANMISQNSSHRFVSDSEKGYWNGKVNKSDITGGALKANADRLQGKPISTTTPEEMQALRYVGGEYVPSDSVVRGYCSTGFNSSNDYKNVFNLPFAPSMVLVCGGQFFHGVGSGDWLYEFDTGFITSNHGRAKVYESNIRPTKIYVRLVDNTLEFTPDDEDELVNSSQSFTYILVK